MNRSILAMTVASLLSHASYSYAQEVSADETMVVTANRFEQQVSDTIAPVEVVTKQEIDAIQATSLSDVLRRLPGVQVTNQGGLAQGQELYIRGRSTKNTLVLINGVRVGSATLGYANLAAVPLNGVERIEVLRGARAAVYGSDAVSGVVNIITTKGASNSGTVKAGTGSHGLYDVNASGSVSSDAGWLNVSATHQQSEGYNIQPTSINSVDADKDGHSTQYLTVDGGFKASPNLTLKANGYYQKHDVEFDNPWGGVDNTDSELYALGLVSDYKHDKLNSVVTLAANQDEAESYGQGTTPSAITTNRQSVSWNNQYAVNESAVVVGGVDWYQDKVKNESTAMTKDSRNNKALYAGGNIAVGELTAEANVRWDDNSSFGNFTTYQVGTGYHVTESVRLVAMYGTAFKAPTFNELYWPLECGPWGCYSGNPDLEPEESQTGELAIEANLDFIELRIAAHSSDVEKMIASNGLTQVNIGEAEVKGYEVVGSFYTGPLYHTASYDYLDTEDKSTGNQLARRAKHSAKLNTTYELNDWRFDLSYLYQGKRFDDLANTTELDAYSLFDLAASYHFANGVTVAGKVANLFDEEYETAQGYKTPERNYYVSVAYQF
jgi:vitamin B12 transporter